MQKKEAKWTPWMENPIAAAYAVAREHGIDRSAIDAVLLQVEKWQSFCPQDFLDDLLQEIAGKTNIVVQYDNSRNQMFRAALDT